MEEVTVNESDTDGPHQHSHLTHGQVGHGRALRLDKKPILVFWETTKACPLACSHCRAQAISHSMPGELDSDASRRLIEQVASFGTPPPILVLTGGDIMMRPDKFELIKYASDLGIRVAISPAVSEHLSDKSLDEMYRLGVRSASISLDGIDKTHDLVRGIDGHYSHTLEAISRLLAHGFSVQVNSTVMRTTYRDLPAVAEKLLDLGVKIWEVFFLIQVGRGTALLELAPDENEDVARFLYDVSSYGLLVRTVEAPFFRRVAANLKEPNFAGPQILPPGDLYRQLSNDLISRLGKSPGPAKVPSVATRDGKGIIFVAHNGDVYPSGFLPVSLGNIKSAELTDIYRNHPLLHSIREAKFSGRCGVCGYRDLCGGSRSRAFAAFGDPLAEDPACGYLISDLDLAENIMGAS